jgi:hypothetical protein
MQKSLGGPVVLIILCAASRASAIPAFARKYHTSCETCHTVYPKLNPFGEAFRHNGFRFPGNDSDFVKQEVIQLGQEAYKDLFPDAVWPGTLPASVPLAFGFNGLALWHPDKSAGGAVTDNGARFTLANLIAEAHLWAGGSFDDTTTFFGEVTVSNDGTIDIEDAQVLFNDLIGPQYLVNLVVGRTIPSLSSFGPHSSYIADTAMPIIPMTALWGAMSESFAPGAAQDGVELRGTYDGRLDYAVGINAGANVDIRTSQDVHAHVGVKVGGARLDGVGGSTDIDHEHAITVDVFAARARSRFTNSASEAQDDIAYLIGWTARAQWAIWELDTGVYYQQNRRALVDGRSVSAAVQWNELSWLAYPWLNVAARIEYVHLDPDHGGAVSDLRITPGVAALVRPNVKLTLTIPIERASGAPSGGWAPGGGAALPSSASDTVGPEVESIVFGLSCAF